MKKSSILLAAALLSLGILSAPAQFGGPGQSAGSPNFSGSMDKLFGDNQSFTASVEVHTANPRTGGAMVLPGKLSFDAGKSRFEMDMTEMKGGNMSPSAAAQMKAMGMDQIVNISLPDKKMTYLIYPGMQSYVEMPVTTAGDSGGTNDFQITSTKIGNETIYGHDCVKNDVVVTGQDGVKHESTVWNATDLKNFPIQIAATEGGNTVIMVYTDVSLKSPDASVFDVPVGFTKYSSPQEMVQGMIAKKMGMMGRPPGQ